jgi:uncharacterized GH25 family protein
MNRKLLGALGGVLVVALAVWFFALRDRGTSTPKPSTPETPTTPVAVGSGSGSAAAPEERPKGMAPTWVADTDPEGPLRLEGQVMDEHGDGVGKAIVAISSVPPRTATTEDDGTFAFDKVVGREYTISARAGDLVGGPLPYHLTATSDPAVLRMIAGATVSVTVLDDAGAAVPNATVSLVSVTAPSSKTGPDGLAKVKPVQPGWATIKVVADGFASASSVLQVGSTGVETKVTLHKGYSLSGRVVDEAGKPIAGVHVIPSNVFNIPCACDPSTTDAKGAFTFSALTPGTHILVATDETHAQAHSTPITLEDKAVSGIEIVMQAGAELGGTVVDSAGKPVAFSTVRIGAETKQMWEGAARQTTTNQAGAFELRGVARTKLKLRAESDASASSIVAVDMTTELVKKDIKLVLDVNGAIAGSVVDETGQPVAEVSVNAFPDILGGASGDAMTLAGMSAAMTDGGGHFTIRGLPEGAYRVRAARSSGRGQYDWGQDGVKARTGDKAVKITLAAPGSLTGRLVLESGGPPAFATVQLGSQPPANPAKDGTFAMRDLPPGNYDLRVRGLEFAPATKQDVVIAPGTPTDVGTITLVRGRKLVGKVVDGDGKPVAGARVKTGDMLYSMQGADDAQMATFEEMSGVRSATTDREGSFTLVGIAKKQTNLMADHPSQGRSDAVVIPEGTDDPPAITLTLHGFGQIVGTVTSQGKPIAGATVTASPKGGGAQVQVAQTETNGSFTLAKVPEGTVVISAMQQSTMALKSASATVQVTARKQTKVTIDIPIGSVALAVQIKPLPNNQVDAAQVFLFRGVIAIKTAKQVNEAFLGGQVVGMKFWLGEGKPLPEFDQLVPGDYSICAIPILGDLNDSKFQQRLQEHLDTLAVYCKQAKVLPSPSKQTVVHEVPAMTPLPPT